MAVNIEFKSVFQYTTHFGSKQSNRDVTHVFLSVVSVVVDGDQEDGAGEDEQQQHRAAQTCKPPYRTRGPDLAWLGAATNYFFPEQNQTTLVRSDCVYRRRPQVMSYTGALAWINSLVLCSVVTLCNAMEFGSFVMAALSPPTVGAKLIARCFMHHERERPSISTVGNK